MSNHKKDPDYPLKPYGHFVKGVALNYFKRLSLESLKWQFLDHGKNALTSLQIDLFCKFTKSLAFLEMHNTYNRDYR
jgi:hypothetical protein